MNKKYIPYIILVLAALLLFWIKQNQRGAFPKINGTNTTTQEYAGMVDRDPGKLVYSKHATCRMQCRMIDESEVREILDAGTINYDRIEKNNKGVTIPLEGITHDRQKVRIVVAPKKTETVVVTVIDLDTDWPCDCP